MLRLEIRTVWRSKHSLVDVYTIYFVRYINKDLTKVTQDLHNEGLIAVKSTDYISILVDR